MVKRLLVAVFFACLLMPNSSLAQRSLGVDWDPPSSFSEAAAELRSYDNLGITYLQIQGELPEEIWQVIEEHNFRVQGKLPIAFPVAQTFSNADSSQIQAWLQQAGYFNSREMVESLQVFAYGPVRNQQFQLRVSNFVEKLKSDFTKHLSYLTTHTEPVSIDSLFKFKTLGYLGNDIQTEQIGAFYYEHAANSLRLAPVKAYLNKTGSHPDLPVYFDSEWLDRMFQTHPDFQDTIQMFATTSDPVFPLPRNGPIQTGHENAIVIMLLLVWIILAVTYNYNPVYRRSFLRYYSGHKFYVKDVMHRHIRSLFTGNSIMAQHAISGGIIIFCLYEATFSDLGKQATLSHFPFLDIFGLGSLNVFLWGFIFTIAVETLSVLWLRFANPEVTFISQIMNLYPWLLQLNLLVATLAAVALLSGGSIWLIYALGCFYTIFFISSFTVTAFDTGSYLKTNKYWYIAGTAGLYLLLVVIAMVWIFISHEFTGVIQLAASLP